MALVEVRFDDLIGKLDEFNRMYTLWHETGFFELTDSVVFGLGWGLHIDCERAVRVIKELIPKDPLIADCSSAASDCLARIKDAIDNDLHWSFDVFVLKIRSALEGLQRLGRSGRLMSADHARRLEDLLFFDESPVVDEPHGYSGNLPPSDQIASVASPEQSPVHSPWNDAPVTTHTTAKLVSISQVARLVAHLGSRSMTPYTTKWGRPVVTHRGRRGAKYGLEAIRPILEHQFPDAKPDEWTRLKLIAVAH